MKTKSFYTLINSPVGEITLVSDGVSLTGLYMSEHRHVTLPLAEWTRQDDLPILEQTSKQLEEYFQGKRLQFDLPLAMQGSEFQRRVWEELTQIPFGKTISYGELAQRIGNPLASRAVGMANGRNPISIIVPCHRVIGANGSLTGYGGGLDRKKKLIELEQKMARSG